METEIRRSHRLGSDLFAIPVAEGAILYGPKRGIRFLVDGCFVTLLEQAAQG